MSVNKIIGYIVAAVAGWIGYLTLRNKQSATKIDRLERKAENHAIVDEVHEMSDSDLDTSLREHLAPGTKKSD